MVWQMLPRPNKRIIQSISQLRTHLVIDLHDSLFVFHVGEDGADLAGSTPDDWWVDVHLPLWFELCLLLIDVLLVRYHSCRWEVALLIQWAFACVWFSCNQTLACWDGEVSFQSWLSSRFGLASLYVEVVNWQWLRKWSCSAVWTARLQRFFGRSWWDWCFTLIWEELLAWIKDLLHLRADRWEEWLSLWFWPFNIAALGWLIKALSFESFVEVFHLFHLHVKLVLADVWMN